LNPYPKIQNGKKDKAANRVCLTRSCFPSELTVRHDAVAAQ